ncbi:cupin domain-containing protein [Nocardioides massiliensis]|uniref:Mannose-6-phosphate isomerase-like protein (Cupin superfamily) n=1 Tax=Nocardioides massiliensis TaxID=1325935 RepID=A0ABT9NP84_9ACTN|nr:cupin [Nocardioides massiliensis]MDP9822219.1 mannose-6-phosphate isomerase-like protein (cupin superfamily) [Nocardioides massiliensis]
MAILIEAPTRIPVPGGKTIDEYVGRVNTQTSKLSVAHMVAPPGWTEPAQVPAFDEITVVLRGMVRVEVFGAAGAPETIEVRTGQAVLTKAGERVRYSTDIAETEYFAVCLPAFSPETVHRDEGN